MRLVIPEFALTLAAAVFLLAVLLDVLHKTRTVIWLYLLQSLALAALMVVVGHANGIEHLYAAALLTLVVKVILLPWGLLRTIRVINASEAVSTHVSMPVSVAVSAVIAAVAFGLVQRFTGLADGMDSILALSVATVLTSLFLIINRKGVHSQMVGLLSIENGITVATLTVAGSFPFVVEIGVLFDLCMWSLIAVLFLYKIHETFGSVSTAHLQDSAYEESA